MITSLLLAARKNIAIYFKVEICVTLLQYFWRQDSAAKAQNKTPRLHAERYMQRAHGVCSQVTLNKNCFLIWQFANSISWQLCLCVWDLDTWNFDVTFARWHLLRDLHSWTFKPRLLFRDIFALTTNSWHSLLDNFIDICVALFFHCGQTQLSGL